MLKKAFKAIKYSHLVMAIIKFNAIYSHNFKPMKKLRDSSQLHEKYAKSLLL